MNTWLAQKMASIQNKRLAIDLQALRQDIWNNDDDRMESLDISRGDYPRWIDTSTMIADPLTKTMKSDRLKETMETGQLDLRPTPESLAIKEKNRKARKAKKELERECEEAISSIDDGDQVAHLNMMIEKLKSQKQQLQRVIESTKKSISRDVTKATAKGYGKGRGCTIEKSVDKFGGIVKRTVSRRDQDAYVGNKRTLARKVCNYSICKAFDDVHSFGKTLPTATSLNALRVGSTNNVLSSVQNILYFDMCLSCNAKVGTGRRTVPRVTDVNTPCMHSTCTPPNALRPQGPWAQSAV